MVETFLQTGDFGFFSLELGAEFALLSGACLSGGAATLNSGALAGSAQLVDEALDFGGLRLDGSV